MCMETHVGDETSIFTKKHENGSRLLYFGGSDELSPKKGGSRVHACGWFKRGAYGGEATSCQPTPLRKLEGRLEVLKGVGILSCV